MLRKFDDFNKINENLSRDSMVSVIRNILKKFNESGYVNNRDRHLMMNKLVWTFAEELFTDQKSQDEFVTSIYPDLKRHLKESFDDLDQDGKKDVEEEAWFEPEECEYCLEDCEESVIEYEKNFTWENGCWVCDNCGNSQ